MKRLRHIASGNGALFTVPVLLLVMIAALDKADQHLLASSFPMLERAFGLDVKTLGYFSLFTNLSYALALPFWGWLVHRHTMRHVHNVLSASCLAWGMATLGIAAAGSSVAMQALFRSANGAALASILPLSQTMLVELVPVDMRGRAFGFMGLAEKAAGTAASSAIIWFEDWQKPYVFVGMLSVAMAFLARNRLRMRKEDDDTSGDDEGNEKGEGKMSFGQIVRRIARIPAFLCLVGQGIFGGIPWDMMSFLLLLMQWKGFSKEQIIAVQVHTGISGTVGSFMGGAIGDYFAYNPRGRIYVAFVSVVGGIAFFGLFLFADSYFWSVVWINAFNLWGTWTPAAANRPICAQLAQNPSERAQIVAMWVLLEKTSASVFGAPLVGYLTSGMIDEADKDLAVSPEKAQALAWNLFFLSALFWSCCALFWLLMARFIEPTKLGGGQEGDGVISYERVDKEDPDLLMLELAEEI